MSIPEQRLWRLWALMEQIEAGKLMWASALMVGWHEHLRHVPPSTATEPESWYLQSRVEAQAFSEVLNYSSNALKVIGAPISQKIADELIGLLGQTEELPHPCPDHIREKFIPFGERRKKQIEAKSFEFSKQMKLELDAKIVLCVPQSRSYLIVHDDPLFGIAVDEAFPDCAPDIEEAGKCLALGCPTACIFHLMRAAEAVAAELSARIGGKTQNENTGERLTFGGLFVEVKTKVEAMPRGERKDAWLHLQGLMSTLNRGTRTKVAHPGKWYTEAQAEAIFGQTKAFLQEAEELLRL